MIDWHSTVSFRLKTKVLLKQKRKSFRQNDDLFLYVFSLYIEKITLKVKKATSSHHRCCVPNCRTPTHELSQIPPTVRIKAMKIKKIFIPRGSRACSWHQSSDNWNFDAFKLKNKFSTDQIEEMINLLCDLKPKSVSAIEPGDFHRMLILI